ncbi:MAG: thiamine biosynthesis protein ThiF [Lachnospiraceae bacterium]
MNASFPTKEELFQVLCNRHGYQLQQRFAEASVAICGLGGLGSNIALTLARAGIGRLHLIDFDRVDLSNLHRQQYTIRQISMYKTDALKETLLEIAPYMELITHCTRITPEKLHLLQDDSLICEAFDCPEAKAMLVNGVLETFPEKYIVAASGMAGMSSANSIQTRKITDHFYLCGDETSAIENSIGLVASRVEVCAAHEAHMVLRLLAGETNV